MVLRNFLHGPLTSGVRPFKVSPWAKHSYQTEAQSYFFVVAVCIFGLLSALPKYLVGNIRGEVIHTKSTRLKTIIFGMESVLFLGLPFRHDVL